jgi:branched-chain amino acid transport system substrate-binding protein
MFQARRRLTMLRIFGALLLLIGLVWASPAVAADPGVTDAEVVLGMWSPLTGPVALLGTSERDAFQIWVSQINEAGGIHGRKMRLVVYDDGGSPQEALAAVRRLIDQDRVFALVAGSTSGATLPVVPLINRAKIPFMASISTNRRLLDPFSRYIFRIYANEIAQVNGLVDYVVPRFKVTKPALLHTSNDYGVGGHEALTAQLKEKFNLPLVAVERYNTGDQDFSAQLLRIKQAQPDALFIWAFAAEAGIIVRQARELGITARLFGGGATATPLFPRGAGQAGIGFVADFVLPHLPESSTVPAVVSYREVLKKLYSTGLPPGRPSEYDLAGYGAAKAVGEALQRAGRNLTRDRFIDALESLKEFDPGVIFPVTFTKDRHEATSSTTIVRVNEKLEWEVAPK